MALPTVTQNWSYASINQRITPFVSLNDTMAQLIFGMKTKLLAAGYTLKYTCDGTTGPTSSSDHTDRLSDKTKCTTRFNGTAGAQSFWVITDGNGVDILCTYDGATDDVCLIAMSPGGLYVPAGTANQKPTATDECIITQSQTIIQATASADRVWHLWTTVDKKMWRMQVWRQSVGVLFGVEKLTSSVQSPATFLPATWGFFYDQNGGFANFNNTTGSVNMGYSTSGGGIARVHTSVDVNISVGGSVRAYLGATLAPFGVEKPDLQGNGGGELIVPVGCASNTANGRGELGTRIDWWGAWTNSNLVPAAGDTFGNLTLVAAGSGVIWPWDGATTYAIA